MKHNHYPLRISQDSLTFSFESISNHRVIAKLIEFVQIDDQVYNLAFGDVEIDGYLNDLVVSDNMDTKEVLASVIEAVLIFFDAHPNNSVYIKGSTTSRTRLYQIVLNREYCNWQDKFIVYGVCGEDVLTFQAGIAFEAFVIKLKNT
ncbi:DUF6934 family protein [Dyadobacter aurulentus]|uniref:DUF6934 family protein n=1 Tax=Dyadobacter sp. UC 10 TaxID=2605428 RepID=UPI0011F26B7F|nr:hypothetical protein [Dyadobacter sp. UC 10]KAA0989995.1 hypothetical protein FXO21_07400 [Dyadobacter sp. UC 10]